MKLISTGILYFLCTICLFGQSKKEKQLREQFWNANGSKIVAMDIPEKWNNESAIILKDHRYIQYINNGKTVYSKVNKHQIIKILDQSSLEGFSEIKLNKDSNVSFLWNTYSKKETTIGIRIIKPDGTVNIVDVEQEEVIEDDIRKIAVPNLEIGDIIDLFIQFDHKEKEYDGLDVYRSIEATLKDDYPIVDYRIAVEVENDFFLNMNSYNGAPAVKEEETERSATRMYVVEAKNIDKLDVKRWYYPFVEEPSIKIQVAFARTRVNEEYANIFKGEDGERKSIVTEEDVLDYFDRKFNRAYKSSTYKIIKKHIKEGNYKTKAEILKASLEYIRFHKLTKYFEPYFAADAEIVNTYMIKPGSRCYKFYNGMYRYDSQVINDLRKISEEFDIDYDIILVQPRYDGKLDDLLIKDNARLGLQFNTEPKLYFFDFGENMSLERFPEELEGSEAYVGSVIKKKRIENLKRITLKSSQAQDNVYEESINIRLTSDKKAFEVDRELTATGHFEDQYIYDWIHWTDFLEEDYLKHPEQEHFYECAPKKLKTKYTEQFQALREKNKQEFIEKRTETVESEWEKAKVEDYQYTVLETGRYGDYIPLKIKDEFQLKGGYIKKAGKNLILEIGKFIGGQVEIEEKERDRNVGIFLNHPKTYKYHINFTIPDGYKIKGVESLNTSIDNPTGNFMSTAEVVNNQLIIHTTKTYKNNFIESSQWNNMIKWLDEALKFNRSKILLEKI